VSRSKGRSFWQDDEKTIIQFDRFCVVQTLRSRPISLCRRPKFKGVHNLAPASEIEVPAYVLQHPYCKANLSAAFEVRFAASAPKVAVESLFPECQFRLFETFEM